MLMGKGYLVAKVQSSTIDAPGLKEADIGPLLLQEKAHHDAGGVEPDGLRIAAAPVAAEPGVAAGLDEQMFDDRPALGSCSTARLTRPPSVCHSRSVLLSEISAALGLIEDSLAIGRVDRRIGAAVNR